MSKSTDKVLMVHPQWGLNDTVSVMDVPALRSKGWMTREEFKAKMLCEACLGIGKLANEECWNCEGTGEDPSECL